MRLDDKFTSMESAVRFKPTSSIRFIAEELRRYGIKTNQKNDKEKTVFFQSAHIVMSFDQEADGGIFYPSYALVSFKDLFKLIGKNDAGVDDQDRVRVWVIAEKLEKRSCIKITGTASESLEEGQDPVLPDIYVNLAHIHRNDEQKENISYKSKFATNKSYSCEVGTLVGVSDYFVIV